VTITRDPIRDMHRAMGIKESLKDIGAELADHSHQEFTMERSSLEELFPYIMIASKKMSARAISRWFEEKKNLKISAASVAKAIREKDRYCAQIVNRAKAGAEYLSKVSEFDPDAILTGENDEISTLEIRARNLMHDPSEEDREKMERLFTGVRMLDEWTGLPDEIRTLCIETCINQKPKGEDKR
jgi:hypothetical protein